MSFEWQDFLTLARQLESSALADPVCEAKLRSAISRAYYAAFSIARTHLEDRLGFDVADKAHIHQRVWDEFKESGDRSRKKIGYNGDRLKDKRESADYDYVFEGNLTSDAQFSLSLAERTIDGIRKLSP